MKGLDSNGKPVCDVPPPAGCPNQDVTLTCNGTPHTRTLFKAKHGETQTVTAGFSLKRTFQCNNGVWNEIGSQTGLCDCVEDKTKKINKNLTCAVNSDCGARYTGTKDTQSQFLCPAAAWSTVVVKDECACAETFKETSGSCPNGFNKGQINYKNTHICTGTPRCSGKVEVSRTCECVADRTEEPRWCDNGYTGQYKVEKLFKCQSDKTKPGAWTPNWTEVAGHTKADNCKCVPEKLADQNVSCPVGYEGKIVVHTERICEGGSIPKVIETGRTNTCKLIEPVRCKWDDQGTSIGSGSSPKAYLVNQSCECGVDTTAQCSKAAGNDNFKHYFCTCGS